MGARLGICRLTSCDLAICPSRALTPAQMGEDPGGAMYATDGNYTIFKDEVDYSGYESGNSYVRHYFQMAEYPSDNICLSGRTTDVLYDATCYITNSKTKNVQTLWWLAYKAINGANSVIGSVKDGTTVESDYLKGENLFIRAIAHFHLLTLYSKPYSHGRDNLGVVLRTTTNTTETKRATVGECYDQVVADLLYAIELMHGSPRGNVGYASKLAAQGLLSRVYLYMEENQKCIDIVNDMLAGADPMSKLESTATFPTYFANALTSTETLWAVAHTDLETRGQSSLASMYLSDGIGWGEVYASDALNNLYDRYTNDVRRQFILPQQAPVAKKVVTFPVTNLDDANGRPCLTFAVTNTGGTYTFIESGKQYTVEEEIVNGEYTQYYVMYNNEKISARITDFLKDRNTYPMYFVSKFSYQDGDPMLSSPVMLRWAEVILNRAEAYAKLGKTTEALADVNVIRTRAGLSGTELFSVGNMHGYASVLDVVLDERRLELAFEGHRMFDVYRNKRDMDRRFAGAHPWEIVKYDDRKIQYPIPYDEVTVSGIEQNP